jgi:hypothetical protein
LRYIILLTLLLSACTSNETDKQLKRRNLDEYFNSSGVVRYFLSDLPNWANFSQTAACQRSISPRYFNISTLLKSYDYKYEEAIQLQYMFNVEMNKLKQRTKARFLPFSDEEKLFFTLTDKIQAEIRTFRVPTFKRVNIIWIDPILKSKAQEKRLIKLLKSKVMDSGHPVMISMCLNHAEFEEYLGNKGLLNRNIRYMPHEMFAPYTVKGEKIPLFQLYLKHIFKKDQKLYLYLPTGVSRPSEIVGKIPVKRY